MTGLQVGQVVTKPSGYRFDGVVVMAGETLAGKRRVVVDNGDGLLHIFAETQMQAADDPAEVVDRLDLHCWCGAQVKLDAGGRPSCTGDVWHLWGGEPGETRTSIEVGQLGLNVTVGIPAAVTGAIAVQP